MWLLFNDSFISVIASDRDPNLLVVRARRTGDLQQIFGADVPVLELEARDYRYRAFLPRQTVATVIAERLLAIDYFNVKGSVEDSHLLHAYHEVHAVLEELQEIPMYRTKPRPNFRAHPVRRPRGWDRV
ncbi:hypothetical protein [Paraburkholderia haematera]|uniref:Uncharacterized protein n=1 Tax=Paraburkholderia haematera TaxID=2793077 RepID=A0ABM8QSY4_9BURK|nr:hypothetical protein [Paraburkholderia haematera]CAE6713794.1 hypothetical protein R69888_01275 [Paraburkholderia haematera]